MTSGKNIISHAIDAIRHLNVMESLRCRYSLWNSGDPRWSTRAPKDSAFRAGFYLFRDLPLNNVRTLVDVGANEGQFLLPALRYFSPTKALAIEMLPDVAGRLERKVGKEAQVVCCALGSSRQRRRILRSTYAPASSLLPLTASASRLYSMDLAQRPGHVLETRTLDDVCEERGVDSIDLLKIDVQGYELEVLRGGTRVLCNTRSALLEVEFCPIYEGGPLFTEVLQYMGDLGFHLSAIVGQHRSHDGRLLHADALFIRR